MRPSERFNLHRTDHHPSELPTKTFDVICIGSGWAGRVLAARIVQAGFTALIVENELVGGDCPYWACVPSKVLLRSPEVLHVAKNVAGARERTYVDKDVDVAATFQRRDKITMGKDDTTGLIPMVESTGANVVRGTGKLTGVKKVQVDPIEGDPVELEARLAVVLSCGSVPVLPDNIPGLRKADPWTPRDATSADYVPDHLIVMGAGAVGCEMATAYASYGAKVTVIYPSSEIISSVDPEAGKIVREALEARGVTFHRETKIVAVERPTHDEVTVTLSTGKRLSGTELLVAAGRRARLDNLGLESVGVQANSRFLSVNENLCVPANGGHWLYAAGDINGRAPLTHSSKYHAAIAANAILAHARNEARAEMNWSSSTATADNFAIPQVIFTDPVVASVGLTRKKASEKGKTVRQVTASMTSPGYNIHVDNPAASWAQWLLDEENRVVGATFVGTDAAEVLHASTVAIVSGVKLDRLLHAIPSFPSISWVYYNLMDAAGV